MGPESGTRWECNSAGEAMKGFRYLRKAGSGMWTDGSGRRSSVNCGELSNRDPARWSFCRITGAVKLENDAAADLRIRREAVRLDLNDDLDFVDNRASPVKLPVSFPGSSSPASPFSSASSESDANSDNTGRSG